MNLTQEEKLNLADEVDNPFLDPDQEEPENEENRRRLTTILTLRLSRQLTIENLERANEYMMALQEQQETGGDPKAAVMTFIEADEIFKRVMSLDDSTREWFINGLIDADLEKREKCEEKESIINEIRAMSPEEGTTVAETTAVLEAFRKLDKLARDILIKQVLKDEEAAING